ALWPPAAVPARRQGLPVRHDSRRLPRSEVVTRPKTTGNERLEKDERREQGISGDRPDDLPPADGDVQSDAPDRCRGAASRGGWRRQRLDEQGDSGYGAHIIRPWQ